MKLKSLSLEPAKFFESVSFDSGINFVYAYKNDSNDSLNGVGKSLFLDFIDFALLGHFNPARNSRFNRAFNANLFRNLKVILVFSQDGKDFTLVRSFNDPQKASLFSEKTNYKDVAINSLSATLFSNIYYRDSYPGFTDPKWFKFLKHYYCKIQKVSEEKFTNPVSFSNADLNTHFLMHFFLLNLNNHYLNQYYGLLKQSSVYKNSIKAAEEYLLSNSGLANLSSVSNKLTTLNNQISQLQKSLEKIDFSPYYADLQKDATHKTKLIKDLVLYNVADQQTIKNLSNNDEKDPNFDLEQTKSIFDEVNPELSAYITKSLDDAVKFRKSLRKIKKEFNKNRIARLKGNITMRERKIDRLKDEQAQIIKELSSQNIYSDFKSIHRRLNTLIEERSQLQTQFNLRNEMLRNQFNFKNQLGESLNKIKSSLSAQQNQINDFSDLIGSVYKSIFNVNEPNALFSIVFDSVRENVAFNILTDDIYSHGRNQGRTLVYDLAVLINSVKQNLKAPRFLIHDGIFDSLDDRHLLSLYKFIQTQLDDGIDFQYIVTLNHLDESFTKNDSLNHDKLMDIAKVKVSNSNKLLGVDF